MNQPRAFKYAKALLFSYTLTLMVSCVRETVMAPEERPFVVVECVLCEESFQTLSLSYSKAANGSGNSPIVDGRVILTDLSDNGHKYEFTHYEKGVWTCTCSAIQGHAYRLEVLIPGQTPVLAETSMPSNFSIDYNFYSMYSNQQLPEKYNLHPYAVGIIYTVASEFPIWVWGVNYNPDSGIREMAEEMCTDYSRVDSFNLSGALYESLANNPMLYFLDQDLTGRVSHMCYLRLNAFSGAPEDFLISGSLYGDHMFRDTPSETEGFLIFETVSDEYDLYLKDALTYLNKTTEYLDIYRRDNLYSNIVGGIGVFGAKIRRLLPWYNPSVNNPMNPYE